MIQPSKKDYDILKHHYDRVPVHEKFIEPYHTPVAIFEKLKTLKPSYLLESLGDHQAHSRYSYIGFSDREDLALDELIHDPHRIYEDQSLPPFYYGYIGYLSYDNVKDFHNINLKHKADLPKMQVLKSKVMVIIDHFTSKVTIVCNTDCSDKLAYDKALNKIQMIKKAIQSSDQLTGIKKQDGSLTIQANMTKTDFMSMVDKAKSYIEAGDIFQVVLSQQFTARSEVASFDIYKTIRSENPSPYLSYLDFGDLQIVCSSPEMLMKHTHGKLQTVPIAGTRALKFDGLDDQRAQDLIHDEKELAEHLMLVDLGRNDIGRVSKPGSVQVDEFCQLKKFSKVMHLTSHVSGQLKATETPISALKATFPAGTVTGAPKSRAMAIIDELEPDPRGVYAGAIFYLNHNGNLNSCIAIRTLTIKDKELCIQSGAGIVWDSVAENEYKETLHKAQALFDGLSQLYKGGLTYDFTNR